MVHAAGHPPLPAFQSMAAAPGGEESPNRGSARKSVRRCLAPRACSCIVHQHLVGQTLHLGGHTGMSAGIKQQWQRLRAQELQPSGNASGMRQGTTVASTNPLHQNWAYARGETAPGPPDSMVVTTVRSSGAPPAARWLHHGVATGGQPLVQQRIKLLV